MRGGMARRTFGFGTGAQVAVTLALMLGCAVASLPAHAGNSQAGLMSGLVRLAEILGSVHHLREVCGADEGALWRNKMIDMMNVASLDTEARQRMISHFNDAYYQARSMFPECSRSAAAKSNALFDEGRRLAASLARGNRNATAAF